MIDVIYVSFAMYDDRFIYYQIWVVIMIADRSFPLGGIGIIYFYIVLVLIRDDSSPWDCINLFS